MEQRILLRAANWLGDAVMMTPAMIVLREKYPHASITLLIRENLAGAFLAHPCIDRVISIKRSPGFNKVKDFIRLIRELRALRFDLGYLFPNSFSSALIMFMGRVKKRTGYRRYARGIFLTEAIKFNKGEWDKKHHILYYLNLVDSGRKTLSIKQPVITVSDDMRRWAGCFFREHGIKEDRIKVGFSPGANYGPAKMWPSASFAELGLKIKRIYSSSVMIFGTQSEEPIASDIKNKIGEKAIGAAGKTGSGQLASLISRCNVMVCNDSGTAHLSAALGVPTIVIFGSSAPARTCPRGRAVYTFCSHIECSPCLKRVCPLKENRYKCMARITPDMVFEKVKEILDKTSV